MISMILCRENKRAFQQFVMCLFNWGSWHCWGCISLKLKSMYHKATYCRHIWLSDGFISGHVHGHHPLQASLEDHRINDLSHVGTINPWQKESWLPCPQEGNWGVCYICLSLAAWKASFTNSNKILIRHILLAFFLSYLIFHSHLLLPDSSQINYLYTNYYLSIYFWRKPN